MSKYLSLDKTINQYDWILFSLNIHEHWLFNNADIRRDGNKSWVLSNYWLRKKHI